MPVQGVYQLACNHVIVPDDDVVGSVHVARGRINRAGGRGVNGRVRRMPAEIQRGCAVL